MGADIFTKPETLERLRDDDAIPICTLQYGHCRVEVAGIINLAGSYNALVHSLEEAGNLLAQSRLDAVLYGAPFRMHGWSVYECMYRVLIIPF